ncbi:MAG: hypothetical protein WBD93_01785 [Acidobacteriaceae bacterium]
MAQPPASTQQNMEQQQSWNLVGVDAQLQQGLNTKNARRGQTIEARLYRSVETANGTRLHRGTALLGKIERVQASTNHGPAVLSVVFTKAQLRNGRTIPVKVTIIGAYPADEALLIIEGDRTIPPAPRHIGDKASFDQEPGSLHRVSLHSAVQNSDSATFREKRGNLKLYDGTFLQIGIASSQG